MAAAQDSGRLAFIQKVYGLFLGGVLVSLATAAYVVSTPKIRVGDLAMPLGVLWSLEHYLLVVIAFFATFFIASAVRRTPGVNLLVMYLFTATSGWLIAPRLWIATYQSPGAVPLAGAITATVFVGLSVYAWLSRTDFNFLGAGLTVALLGLIVGSLLNAFVFHSSWAYMFMAWIGVVIFSGYVLYDTSVILRRLPQNEYVHAALALYLDFINLFLMILRIVGGGRR